MGLQITYSGDQLQSCSHGALGVVFVRLRIPEVDQYPVAHVFRDEAAEALHGLSDTPLIGRDDLAEVFRILVMKFASLTRIQ